MLGQGGTEQVVIQSFEMRNQIHDRPIGCEVQRGGHISAEKVPVDEHCGFFRATLEGYGNAGRQGRRTDAAFGAPDSDEVSPRGHNYRLVGGQLSASASLV